MKQESTAESSPTDFVCECEGNFYTACKELPFYGEHGGKQYCVLHFPSQEKEPKQFWEAVQRRASEDYDYSGVYFPDRPNFGSAMKDARFAGATFPEGADSKWASFEGSETNFDEAVFGGKLTSFHTAFFRATVTSFSGAIFGSAETRFNNAHFSSAGIYFTDATFKEKVVFRGNRAQPVFRSLQSEVSFAGCRMDKPFAGCRMDKPEMLVFDGVLLRPRWFIYADVRKADFTDVAWYGLPGGPKGKLKDEIEAFQRISLQSPHYLLAQACQRLAANAEENRDHELASEFNYWAMDVRRREKWGVLSHLGGSSGGTGLRVVTESVRGAPPYG